MPIQVFFLEFLKGYHVGWRRAKAIIDHTTILRALMSIAYSLGDTLLIDKLSRGEIASTALLPAIENGGRARLLTPFPILPSLVKASRLGVSWTTLYALNKITSFAQRCVEARGKPMLMGREGDRVVLRCIGTEKELRLAIRSGVACVEGDDCSSLPSVPSPLLERISEYHNRIDRVTGAADLYRLDGWKPNTLLWLGIGGDEEALKHVASVLEILSELGIGAYRSRGWGLFKLRAVAVHELEKTVLDRCVGWRSGYNALLGSALPADWLDPSLTYARPTVITGISGPSFEEYRLPLIQAMDVSSLVYAKKAPSPTLIRVSTSLPNREASMIFNPLVVSSCE